MENTVDQLGNYQIVPIEQIHPNPFQPRADYGNGDLENLMESIQDHGLLQPPTARRVNSKKVELAFGHRRWMAIKNLGMKTMPVFINDLDDELMFTYAITENSQRADLTPIETANAMVVYRDQFGKNATEIGKLFGIAASTVRGKLRLLELPEPIQDKIASNEIPERAARQLLGIKSLGGDTDETAALMEVIITDISDGYTVEDALDHHSVAVADLPNVFEFDSYYFKRDQAGKELWPLDWNPRAKHRHPKDNSKTNIDVEMPPIKLADIKKGIPELTTWFGDHELKAMVAACNDGLDLGALDFDIDQTFTEKLEWLSNPGSCSGCPFHTVVNDNHYCGIKTCYERKKAAFRNAELARMSHEMNLPAYDQEIHGEWIGIPSRYADKSETWDQWMLEDDPHHQFLALQLVGTSWDDYVYTKHPFIQLVSFDPEFFGEDAAKEQETKRDEGIQRAADSIKAEKNLVQTNTHFTYKVCAPLLAGVIKVNNSTALDVLCRVMFDNYYEISVDLETDQEKLDSIAFAILWQQAYHENDLEKLERDEFCGEMATLIRDNGGTATKKELIKLYNQFLKDLENENKSEDEKDDEGK